VLILAAAILALGQETHRHAVPPSSSSVVLEIAGRPVALRPGIGSAHDAVGTTSKEAQAFYDQGLAYLHSYVWLEAARSFNQALRIDPNLGVAFAGLSLAYTELNAAAAARDALAKARALAPSMTAHDRQHIEARALQAAAESTPGDAAKLAAYRAAIASATTRYPADEEFWLARGQSESSDPAERGQGSVAASAAHYLKAAAIAPDHFAAHHYLTHSYENTGRVEDALAAGQRYARMAPKVPHARHMHAHNLRRVGRIEEAIAEFAAADVLETEYFKTEKIPVDLDWHYQHNLDLLGTSYQYVGQMAKAEARLKASFAIPSSLLVQEFNKREWPSFLVARGRPQEALEAANVLIAHRAPVVSATGHVAAGFAHLALRDYKAASDAANAALRLIRGAEGGALVAAPLQLLQGEFFLRTGQKEKARPLLEEVAKKVRAAPGPDAWTQALFALETIARAARDAGDWPLASWAAGQMLAHDPHYAGTHLALGLVAQQKGDAAAATREFALVRQYWKNADPDLVEWKQLK
jgi:tetratricopeptide (TPR) repeat protein